MTVTRRQFGLALGVVAAASQLSRTTRAQPLAAAGLERRFAEGERQGKGRLGVAVLDTGTGQLVGHRAGERFPLCSTFKALACAAVLARVDAGQEELGRRVHFEASDLMSYSPVTKHYAGDTGMTLGELCSAAIRLSDNTAANLILASLGGPSAVTSFARSLGDPVTRLDRMEGDLNEAIPGDPRDTTSPGAMVADLRALTVGSALSGGSRTQLVEWLIACETGGSKLRAGVPPSWHVGDKTGTGGHGTTNDVAVMWPPGRAPVIVAVYLTETTASDAEANAVFAAVGQAVGAALG